MHIAKALRGKTSFCRICGKTFDRGEKYIALDGSFRVMRGKMCLEHFQYDPCDNCADRMKCVTDVKLTRCIHGKYKKTKVEER